MDGLRAGPMIHASAASCRRRKKEEKGKEKEERRKRKEVRRKKKEEKRRKKEKTRKKPSTYDADGMQGGPVIHAPPPSRGGCA